MATLSHVPSHLFSFSSSHYHKTNFLTFFYRSCFTSLKNRGCYGRQSIVCLASTKKSRSSRKLMSDEELCDALRDFVASVGLPENHVPSTKDLSKHGRKDLANIVRRRGHKLVEELLSNSSQTVFDGSETVVGASDLQEMDDKVDGIFVKEETGQEDKVYDLTVESTDVPLMDDSSTAGNGLVTECELAVSSNDHSHTLMKSQASLHNKVENFMKYGELDAVEDDLQGDLGSNFVKEGKSSGSADDFIESEPMMLNEVDIKHLASVSKNSGLNGTLVVPNLPALYAMEENVTRDIYSSAEGQPDTGFHSDMNLEGRKMRNEVEVNHLKDMLHQKELELSRLKEEIEKEKQALAVLQSKAESEISKAQMLISEKDVELLAAEESLSGVVEAKIQYSGEGQKVEVGGSFNGWHQRIKMEPQPSSALLNPVGTRNPTLWSTTLWLYPGVYEIKFVVDGQWKIDPQIESTIRDGMENNILRVGR